MPFGNEHESFDPSKAPFGFRGAAITENHADRPAIRSLTSRSQDGFLLNIVYCLTLEYLIWPILEREDGLNHGKSRLTLP